MFGNKELGNKDPANQRIEDLIFLAQRRLRSIKEDKQIPSNLREKELLAKWERAQAEDE